LNACHGGITPGARYARSGWKRRAGGGRIDFTVASRLRIEVSRHFVATWTAAVRFAVYQLAFLLFEAAVTLRALLGDYRMSSGFSHYLHSLRWHRNTPGQSWWAVATNMTRGVSQHLPFLVLTPACLAVDALPVCFSAAVSPQVVTRAIGWLGEVLPAEGEETAKSGACLYEALVRLVTCGRFRRVLAPVHVRVLNLACLLAVCARRCCAGCLAWLRSGH